MDVENLVASLKTIKQAKTQLTETGFVICSFVPTKNVLFVYSNRHRWMTQEEFTQKRQEAAQKIVGLIERMNGPTKGKGALKARAEAGRQLKEILNYKPAE